MNTNQITNDKVTVQIAPWFEQLIEAKNTSIGATKVAAPVMDKKYTTEEHYQHNPTDPIYDLNDVERMKQYFLNRKGHKNVNIRDYAYFVFSLNMSRRAGDILALHVYDILNPDGSFKTHIVFNEQKTGKKSMVFLNSKAREALVLYFNTLGTYNMSDWLFPNSKDHNRPMEVQGMRRMLQRTVATLGIDMHIGTHSLRKTIPYHAISQSTCTEDEVMVSQFLNHNNIKTTYHYIKRSQTDIDQFIEAHAL